MASTTLIIMIIITAIDLITKTSQKTNSRIKIKDANNNEHFRRISSIQN